MTIGIYALYYREECLYVGQSIEIENRFITHKRKLSNGTHHCISLQKFYDKEIKSKEKLDLIILKESNKESLTEDEKKFFNDFKPQFWSREPSEVYKFSSLSNEVKKEIYSKRKEKAIFIREEHERLYGEKVRLLYLDGKRILSISKILKIPYSRVRNILLDSNIKIRDQKENVGAEWKKNKTDKEIIALIKSNKTSKISWENAAKKIGASTTSLRETAKELNILTPKKVYTVKDFFREFGEDVIREFLLKEYVYGDLSAKKAADYFGVSKKNVLSAIIKLELNSIIDGKELMRRKLTKRNLLILKE